MLQFKLQRFSQDRILGSSATVAIYGPNGPVNVMEVDSCKETRKSSQKQFQPLGEVGEHTQDIYEGYELNFSGGVVDPSYDDLVDQVDQAAMNGQQNLRFRVTQTIEYYGGTTVTYVYPNTVLYGFEKDSKSAKDDITWSFKGASRTRTKG
ncbi:hypothetical protein LLE49_19520 [Alicyclobacillus tolerans]|uniref:hypothetical protein n=1 Tax=Alicyclobacillus tolerans TaxID=90970 RepID=UPI001F3EC308|nr:hypothetical protein [Alicyclobacillus tolerans]MCF8566912.1 hypothetical protein [Alicyclobacillus tolerans]